MLTKQFGALHLVILAALLISSIIIGLGVLIVLDRAMLASSAGRMDLENKTYSARPANSGTTTVFEVGPRLVENPLGVLKDGSIKASDIDRNSAKDALRNAPAEAIQDVVKTRTGKTLSVDKIESARQKALSSGGQQKINEALKRRNEVDTSTLLEKLNGN